VLIALLPLEHSRFVDHVKVDIAGAAAPRNCRRDQARYKGKGEGQAKALAERGRDHVGEERVALKHGGLSGWEMGQH
jgi:hypothetical protein